ncbi:fluoride efflux transporter CrcB [Desulfotomaculum defluvii]
MNVFLLVAVGGFLGAMSRFGLNNYIQSKHNKPFPFGTFTINITGSFLLGLLFGYKQLPSEMFFLLGTGFMGAFTTFSTFELEAVELMRKKEAVTSLLYLVVSVVVGVILAYGGFIIGKQL